MFQTTGKYILDEQGNVVEEKDLLKWAEWFEQADEKRKICLTVTPVYKVSTVFIGLDLSFSRMDEIAQPPELFETMVFGGPHDGYMERYSTKAEAEEGHKRIVNMVNKNLL